MKSYSLALAVFFTLGATTAYADGGSGSSSGGGGTELEVCQSECSAAKSECKFESGLYWSNGDNIGHSQACADAINNYCDTFQANCNIACGENTAAARQEMRDGFNWVVPMACHTGDYQSPTDPDVGSSV